MQHSILNDLRQLLATCSKKQRLIASYILANHEEAAFLTSTQLAEKSDVSEATVIRFSASLGFERYADMQEKLRDLLKTKLSQIERFERSIGLGNPDNTLQTAARFMHTDILSIEKTLARLNEGELETIVSAIGEARRVYVIGTRTAYGLAYYFGHSLSWIRENVHVLDGGHTMAFDRIAHASPADVALAISFPPYPVNTVRMLRCAVDSGMKAIAVTDSHAAPIAQIASHALLVHNELMSLADNAAPAVSLLTLLLGLVSGHNPERTARHLDKQNILWERSGVYCDGQDAPEGFYRNLNSFQRKENGSC